MNKQDLIEVIANAGDTSNAAAGRVLDAALEAISNSLANGDSVMLVGFGSFVVSDRAARTGRNPQTGEAISIPAARVPKFKAGKKLKDRVNNK